MEQTGARRIGKYEVLRELGRGGTGVVYEARDVELDRRVALKLLDDALDPGVLGRFRAEAEACGRLRHPGIVGVHAAGAIEGRPYLDLELVEGEPLSRRLEREGPLAAPEAAQLVRQVAASLAYAHAQGILHRDLKPSNVLLDRLGAPRLTDFGLARDVAGGGRLTRTGEIVGTPAYMAPEQARGDRAATDARVDVYGLGGLLYACLTGRPPFSGDSLLSVLTQVTTQPPPPPAQLVHDVDPGLEAVCLRCLEKEPGRRYPTAAAVAEALAGWRGGGGRRARRRLAPLVALGGIGLACAVAVLVGLGTGPTPPRTAPERAAPADGDDLLARGRPAAAARAFARALAQGEDPAAREGLAGALAAAASTALPPHPGRVEDVVFSGDGARLATLGGGEARVWDRATGRLELTVEGGVQAVTFDDAAPDDLVTAHRLGADVSVRRWSLPGGSSSRRDLTQGPVHPVEAFRLAACGERVALAASSPRGRVTCWNVPEDAQVKPFFTYGAGADVLGDLAFTPDARFLVVAPGATGAVQMSAVRPALVLMELQGRALPFSAVLDVAGAVTGLASRGRHLAGVSASREVVVWDLTPPAAEEAGWRQAPVARVAPRAAALTCGLGPALRVAVATVAGAVEVWDAAVAPPRYLGAWEASAVVRLAVAPDGGVVATGHRDGAVRLWRLDLLLGDPLAGVAPADLPAAVEALLPADAAR